MLSDNSLLYLQNIAQASSSQLFRLFYCCVFYQRLLYVLEDISPHRKQKSLSKISDISWREWRGVLLRWRLDRPCWFLLHLHLPSPCIYAKSKDTHFAKSSPQKHLYFPLSAKAEINSAKNLTQIQHCLKQLDLIYTELWIAFYALRRLEKMQKPHFKKSRRCWQRSMTGMLTRSWLSQSLRSL